MKRLSQEKRAVTIRDVAQQAGVSVAAASYALNNTGRVSALTKATILQAANELGYTPSLAAQVLKGRKGNLVAILTDGFAGPWYGEFLERIQPALKDAGHTVLALTLDQESLALCRTLVDSGWIQGLVVLNPGADWASFLVPMLDLVPTVVFDPDEHYQNAVQFAVDNRSGVKALMNHLWERGYRDFLWLDGEIDLAWDARERYQAFSDFLGAKNFSELSVTRLHGGFKADLAYRAVREFLSTSKPPRVIVAANDESASGALRAVREKGLSVPRDVAVTGFDGLDSSAWTEPPLTTLSYDRRDLGARMAAAILDALQSGETSPRRHILEVTLVVRASS